VAVPRESTVRRARVPPSGPWMSVRITAPGADWVSQAAGMAGTAQVTMIPVFLIWRQARLIDTFWPLIMPAFFGGAAFNIFLLRQFFLSLPRELDEAALVDDDAGAGRLEVLPRAWVDAAGLNRDHGRPDALDDLHGAVTGVDRA